MAGDELAEGSCFHSGMVLSVDCSCRLDYPEYLAAERTCELVNDYALRCFFDVLSCRAHTGYRHEHESYCERTWRFAVWHYHDRCFVVEEMTWTVARH